MSGPLLMLANVNTTAPIARVADGAARKGAPL
ncbi:hypothetical protein A051pD_gene0043 [Aeromonas phage A051]|uniref:Uncharacterized protein n=1 Tax=Aeromonas phage A051 TaxID=2985286 RepID=A0A9X9P1A1_9CAUD|nr:hypothetical protein A051pD_gene0043 [Aeromonas phage A051]